MDSYPSLTGTVLIMIDVNGTRHHLILGRDDWLQATSAGKRAWEYDDRRKAVQLQAEIYAFGRRAADGTAATIPPARRGAARDTHGHWYWLEPDEEGDQPTRIIARWAAASRLVLLCLLQRGSCRSKRWNPGQRCIPLISPRADGSRPG